MGLLLPPVAAFGTILAEEEDVDVDGTGRDGESGIPHPLVANISSTELRFQASPACKKQQYYNIIVPSIMQDASYLQRLLTFNSSDGYQKSVSENTGSTAIESPLTRATSDVDTTYINNRCKLHNTWTPTIARGVTQALQIVSCKGYRLSEQCRVKDTAEISFHDIQAKPKCYFLCSIKQSGAYSLVSTNQVKQVQSETYTSGSTVLAVHALHEMETDECRQHC
jgi:hypothetical protein